jgi:sialate O-acetylesterase
MVLQMAPQSASLWGFATPGAKIVATVTAIPTAKIATITSVAFTDAQGRWKIQLQAVLPSPPLTPFTVKMNSSLDRNILQIRDVLFGEVWVVSGQSNAAFTLGMQASGSGKLAANATAEIDGSARFADSIRVMNTGIVKADEPQVPLATHSNTRTGTHLLPYSLPLLKNPACRLNCHHFRRTRR